MTVTSDGLAELSSCSDPNLGSMGPRPLPEESWNQLSSWAANIAPYTDVQSDDAVADSMTVTVVFNGEGFGVAEDFEKEALRVFAEQLFTDLQQAAVMGCTIIADSEVTVYRRPSLEADVFGSLAAGESIEVMQQSGDGWFGFDPGVAQAGNVGVFRLRWIAPFAPITIEGMCDTLPIAPPISATACYTMAMSDVSVRSTPEEGAVMIAEIPAGGYASVMSMTMDDWLMVDLSDSSVSEAVQGWISPMDVNFNGPCDALEMVEGP